MQQLLYVADPMCSWCWGFAPVLADAKALLREDVDFQLVLGGLAPDSDVPMEADMRAYVQNAWRAVAERTSAEFNHSFWELHHPKRSTYPACRAVLAAGERADEMYTAIQRAYYLEARDPSDKSTLVAIASELDFDPTGFEREIDAPETHRRLAEDFALRDQLGATGYPSIGLRTENQSRLLASGWNDAESLQAILGAAGLLK